MFLCSPVFPGSRLRWSHFLHSSSRFPPVFLPLLLRSVLSVVVLVVVNVVVILAVVVAVVVIAGSPRGRGGKRYADKITAHTTVV